MAEEASCLFCKIAAKTLPSEIVYEDDDILAFKDVNPQAPTHLQIIPRAHIERVSDIAETDCALIGKLVLIAKKLAKEQGLSENGFRLVMNSGPWAGQSVLHLHLHLLGGRRMSWPPG